MVILLCISLIAGALPHGVVAAVSVSAASTPYERALAYFADLGLAWEPVEASVPATAEDVAHTAMPVVPFYSQFNDITAPQWQGVGCGIASVAMLIDHYADTPVNVDRLLERGIAAGAYLSHAGWTHQGLIDLAAPYGLRGETVGLAHLSEAAAVRELKAVLAEGPVMTSVHYTFEPTNPIPHLVVVTGISEEKVHYNDPAESAGGGTISLEQFTAAWKQRYISIRPTS